jgi:hypothetical protein
MNGNEKQYQMKSTVSENKEPHEVPTLDTAITDRRQSNVHAVVMREFRGDRRLSSDLKDWI